jgi:hypothetical protein
MEEGGYVSVAARLMDEEGITTQVLSAIAHPNVQGLVDGMYGFSGTSVVFNKIADRTGK